MDTIDALKAIEAFAKARDLSLALKPPATEEAIAAAEAALGRPLPAGYRDLLRFADGQGDAASFPWMPGCDRLASIGACVKQLAEERGLAAEYPPPEGEECDGWVLAGRYRAERLPIAGSRYWDGDNTYLDFEPGPNGKEGQLITLVTECDYVVLGESIEHALTRYAAALESGEWVWHPEKKALAPKGAKPHGDHPANLFAMVG